MTGQVIGHYRVIEKIGSGAMGEVFRARDERLGRDVALKLIRPASSANPDHLRRFELEARAAAALNHPNIVAIYDVGVNDGSPYIVCELLEGKTLRQLLAEGALPVRLAVDYSLQIVQGLIAAHDHRIVHRDLKPENLFVTGDGRVKILDFGVAKLQSGEENERSVEQLTTVTKSGSVIGTVAYMAPEQLRGKAVDHRSDLFSLGAILYEMLTGRRAFRGETEVDTITAVLREDPPESNLEEASVPASFRQIVCHCLEKDPEKRFQSARDLAFALETLADASGKIRAFRTRSPRPRTQIVPWALATALLLTTAFLLVKSWQTTSQAPSYHRLTYEQGTIYSARFAPDFHSIVYGAAWNKKPLQIFSTIGDSLLTQPLEISDASLLGVSRNGELALTMHGVHTSHLGLDKGTLARSPLAGGSPREVLENVSWADWSQTNDLAVVHHAEGHDRIEYPIGRVLFKNDGGWISHVRLSPQGDKIAFINHASLWDDRGGVALVDTTGKINILTPKFDSADGLAWSADGKEIWFTAAVSGYTRNLLAVNASGKMRTILSIPAGMTLQDIAPDGRALVSLDAERLAMATSADKGKTLDISWHDWDIAKEISRDGQSVLFEDASEAAPADYAVAIRRIDGNSPIQLGEGSAGGLSPDGKWAIAILYGNPVRVKLYPTGPGQPLDVPVAGLEVHNGSSHFLPDGKSITLNANEPGRGVRCYLVSLDGRKPVPITPEGVTGGLVSPDSQFMISSGGSAVAVYPIAGGTPQSIPSLEADFIPIRWSEDDKSVYGYVPGKIPTPVYKVNLQTGEKTMVQQLQPETTTGVVLIGPVVMTRDGSRFAYSYYQVFSVLYVISGLR
jgi:serine/threonine protein kinase